MAFLSLLKAIVFGLVLLVTGALGTLSVNGVLFPLLLVRPQLYRRMFDFCNGLWEWQVVFLLEKFIGLKVEITGDEIRSDEQSVIVMNHRTCFDWMYFWSVLIRQSKVQTEKIIVKSPLRHLPGPGWGMQAAGFLFLNRKWEDDQEYLKMMLDYYAALDYKTQILIFPEGTDFNARTKQRSDVFAKKNDLEPFLYVLHPRTTGFAFLVSHLKQRWQKVTLYDVTVAFSSTFPQNEVEFFKGILPVKVHFHVKRFCANEVPQTDDDLTKWCKDRWVEKELRLKCFNMNGRFLDENYSPLHNKIPGADSKVVWLDIRLFLVMALWLGVAIAAVLSFMYWRLVQIIFIGQVLMFIYLCYQRSGFDVVQAALFNRIFGHTLKQK